MTSVARQRTARGWCVIGLLTAAAGCHSQSDRNVASAPETPPRVYELHCLGCHGAHGEGAWGPNIQSLNRTDQEIVSVIANGQGKMPAFKGHLSEAQMRELADYVKTFKYKP